ncbi:MAG: hypothetical protein DYG96_11565 [Chlorobi bacterium CHB2]|nr:hypothetical protein [Chlorobi bacterium CHB2]
MLQHQICSFCEEDYQLILRKTKRYLGNWAFMAFHQECSLLMLNPVAVRAKPLNGQRFTYYILRKVSL